MRSRFFLVSLLLAALATAHAAPRKCYSADQASQMVNKDVCVTAHIYDVVEMPDGTRFLDVCAPEVPDELCRFTIVSYVEDRVDVGEVWRYRDRDVRIRGLVKPMHGRAGIILNHARQFNGGPPKFKPNPVLAHGFDAEQARPPIRDPNLRHQGGARGFMNTRDRGTK